MLKPFNKSIFLIVISFIFISPSMADSQDKEMDLSKKSASYFAELYAKTCMAYADNLAVLKDKFTEANVPELSKSKAVKFLKKKKGTVWVIPNVFGDFLVSVDKENNCALYSRFLNINRVERAFSAKLENVSSQFIYQKVQDETLKTKEGPAHIIRYVLTNTENNTKKNYTLTTSKADGVEVQIKASVTHIGS